MLCRYLDACPDGRALAIATGTGRNAVYLASERYQVDAIDRSRAGLRIARENARERGIADRVHWIQADVGKYVFPPAAYDLVTISFFRADDRFLDITEALTPGGVLFVQHYLRTDETVDGRPNRDRHRYTANELLHACLDLTVLHYTERIEMRDDDRRSAIVEVIARNSSGHYQSYPEIEWADLRSQ